MKRNTELDLTISWMVFILFHLSGVLVYLVFNLKDGAVSQ